MSKAGQFRNSRWKAFLCAGSTLALLTTLVLTVAAASGAQAQTFSVFHAFNNFDGSDPNGDLIRDSAGNFYGTAQGGGTSGFGVVYKMDPTGNVSVLYSFTGQADGGVPTGRLLLDTSGNLYGVTATGGDPNCNCGTVFVLTTTGLLTVLHQFTGGTDGALSPINRRYGLVAVGAGLYGATTFGGSPHCDVGLGCGTLFKVSGGQETVLFRFSTTSAGVSPSDLIRDQAGNLYGASAGSNVAGSDGAIFKLDTTGKMTTLYSFTGGADGGSPLAVTGGANGLIDGIAYAGGSSLCFCGVVFSVDPTTGKESVLHAFGTVSADGNFPSGSLLRVGGNLFGTTFYGGTTNSVCSVGCGVVYRIASTGTYSVVYRFTGGADGQSPGGRLIQDAAGNLYGASTGGTTGNGLIFKITP